MHGGNFRQQHGQQAALVQQVQAVSGAAFGEDANQFVAHALGRDARNQLSMAPDGREGFRLNRESQPGGEAYGAQQAQMVFAKACVGIADGADQPGIEIGTAPDVIEHWRVGGRVGRRKRLPHTAGTAPGVIEHSEVVGRVGRRKRLPHNAGTAPGVIRHCEVGRRKRVPHIHHEAVDGEVAA